MKHWKHLFFVAIIVMILSAAFGFALQRFPLLPVSASRQAEPIDSLFGLHLWVIAFLFSLIIGFVLYSVIVFRRKKGDTEDGDYIEGNTTLEIVWTILPLITVITFSFLGANALAKTMRVDPQAMRVNVIASQWSWRFEYPEEGITSNQLVLPVNRQVLLKLRSLDVIHSFWVPEFRVKQDVLPGDLVRELRITPTKTGDFRVRCAELCGREHAYMTAPVIVKTQAEYTAWVAEQLASVSEDPVERGRAWAQQFGCAACHSFDGSEGPQWPGPTWAGIFGEEVELADGTTVVVDAAYLQESIREPGAKIVAGYNNIMPANIGADLTEEQIQDIIAFIESLK